MLEALSKVKASLILLSKNNGINFSEEDNKPIKGALKYCV